MSGDWRVFLSVMSLVEGVYQVRRILEVVDILNKLGRLYPWSHDGFIDLENKKLNRPPLNLGRLVSWTLT